MGSEVKYNPFRIHAGLPALGGVEWLEAMATKLENYPAHLIDHAYLAAGLRDVGRTIRRSVLKLDAAAGRAALSPAGQGGRDE